MKNKKNALLGIIIMLAGLTYPKVQAQPRQGTVIYQLDVKKSKLLWKAPKNKHYGFILFNSGTLSNVVAGWPTQGAFSMNMNSMKSTDGTSAEDRSKVDGELRSEGFFAVSKYPAAAMVVNKILPESGNTSFKVLGALTIKDITKPIEFTAFMKQNGNTLTATANTYISREKWNINLQQKPKSWKMFDSVKDNLIDDQISVTLELVFAKKLL